MAAPTNTYTTYTARGQAEDVDNKIYNLDPLLCPKCQSQMNIVAFIHDPKEMTAIAKNRGIQMYRAPPPLTASAKAENKIKETINFNSERGFSMYG